MYYVITDADGTIIGIIPQTNQHLLPSLTAALSQHFDATEGEDVGKITIEDREGDKYCLATVGNDEREIYLTLTGLYDVRVG